MVTTINNHNSRVLNLNSQLTIAHVTVAIEAYAG